MAEVSEAVAVSTTQPSSFIQARLQNVRYAEKEYWNSRYKSQPCEFDWFYGYTALRKIVRTFLKRSKLVLHIGCGNSNFQEGMAKDGYQVVNTDISDVVIEQMRCKHKHLPGLRYVLSDCRNMPEFLDCQFGSVVDKGTVDALLCSTDAANNIRSMFGEISRVLVPGGVFLLVTLGGPAQRLGLVNRPEFDWTVQVCLVRRVPEDQYAPSAPGRAISLNDTVKPLSYIGPLEVAPNGSVVGLPEPFDPSSYFYAYVCRRAPLLLRSDNSSGSSGCGIGAPSGDTARGGSGGGGRGAVRLPEGWRATVRAVAEVVGGELKLPQGILGRGRRVRTTTRASFEREQRERERAQQAAAQHLQQQQASSSSDGLGGQEEEEGRGACGSMALDGVGGGGGGGGAQDGAGAAAARFCSGGQGSWEELSAEAGGRGGSGQLVAPAVDSSCTGVEDAAAATAAAAPPSSSQKHQEDGATSRDAEWGSGTSTVAETPAAALAAPAAAAEAETDTAAAKTVGAQSRCSGGQSHYQQQQQQQQRQPGLQAPPPSPPLAARPASFAAHISYRRLTATVQDAFSFLDAVDGCNSGSNNVREAEAPGGGDSDRTDQP